MIYKRKNSNVYIRSAKKRDVNIFLSYGLHYPFMYPDEITDPAAYYEDRFIADDAYYFAGFEGEEPIGYGALDPVVNDNGVFHIWRFPFRKGPGIKDSADMEAAKLLLNYGFSKLSLHRISVFIVNENRMAQISARALGFTHEGIMRQSCLYKGVPRDMYIYSMLKGELKWEAEEDFSKQ